MNDNKFIVELLRPMDEIIENSKLKEYGIKYAVVRLLLLFNFNRKNRLENCEWTYNGKIWY